MRLILIILFNLSIIATCQQSINYHRIISADNIPTDFTKNSNVSFKEDYIANDDKKLDKKFFLSTRFFTNQLLQSGKIIFNSPEANYIKNIAAYLLRDNKKLFSQLRFYVLRSNSVNAFSMDQGIIVCTTGLLAYVKNEAQLAFIIGHEISHYTEKHVRNGYIEYKDYEKEVGRYKRLSYYESINQLSRYNKTQEFEADEKGMELFLNSKYDPSEIEKAFLTLNFSYLPFEERPFDVSFLETEYLTLPNFLFPDTIPEIKNNLNYDDAGSTHPNMKKRIEKANVILREKDTTGTKKFYILTKKEFDDIQKSARFESINIDLSDRFYGDVLFKVFLLSKDYPNDRFLDISKVKALYGLSKYKNYNRYSEVTFRINFIEGQSYKLHYLLKKISRSQLNILTYRHIFDLHQKYPSDEEFTAYYKDFHNEFSINSNVDFNKLEPISLKEILIKGKYTPPFDINDSIKRIEHSTLSKIQKLRLKKSLLLLKKKKTNENPVSNFHLYGLSDLVKQPEFISQLITNKIELESQQIKLEKEEEIKKNRVIKKGYKLGMDSIIVIDPVYEDYRLDGEKNEVKSELRKIQIAEMYTKPFKRLNLKIELLDSKMLDSLSITKYNEISLTKDWMSEVMDHGGINMISSTHFQLSAVSEHHNISNYLFPGVYSYKDRKKMTTMHFLMLGTVWLSPISAVDLLMVHNNFEMVSIVINAETDSIEMIDVQDVNLNSSSQNMRSYIFNIMYQINTQK